MLKSVLPSRYSPLQPSGNGNQALYLTELPMDFAEVLGGLIGQEARILMSTSAVASPGKDNPIIASDDLDVWEHRLEEQIQSDSSVRETDREALIRARAGRARRMARYPSVRCLARRSIQTTPDMSYLD